MRPKISRPQVPLVQIQPPDGRPARTFPRSVGAGSSPDDPQFIPNPGHLPHTPAPGEDLPYNEPDGGVPPDRDPNAPDAAPDLPHATPGQRSGGDPFSGLPIPHRTWTTRGGSQVTVAGCCLPLPLGCLTSLLLAGGAVALRSVRGGRRVRAPE